MKILVLSNLFPPNVVGGYERLCADVAVALVAAGHEVTVLTSGYGSIKSFEDKLPVIRALSLLANEMDIYKPFAISANGRAAVLAKNAACLEETIDQIVPDVIFTWNLFFLGESLISVLDRARAPTVFFLTDNWLIAADKPERIGEFFTKHVHGGAPLDTLSPYAVDRLIPHTAIFGAEFVRRLYTFCGYAFVDSRVVHNGVSLPRRCPTRDRRSVVVDGELRLLFAGRMVDLKGPQDALAALPLIQQALPELKVLLTLLGDRQDWAFANALDNAVQQSGMTDRVRFEPPIPEAALPEMFNAHDIYLFPSRYEPFALTLIHALAAGAPTVASDAGGNGEIVRDRCTGMIFALGDPKSLAARVVELARAPKLRKNLALRGQRMAYRFTFTRMLQQIEKTLENIVLESSSSNNKLYNS